MSLSAADSVPALPAIDPGVTLLETDGRATGALHSVVLDELLADDDGEAVWVDAHGHARTQQLAGVAPSMRVLERIRVARAFTPFQHYSLVEALAGAVGSATRLVVLPAVDWFYSAEDLGRDEPAALTAGVAAALDRLAAEHDLPVLLTRSGAGHWAEFADAVDATVRCERTAEGPRFVGDDFETLVYHGAGYVQTTFAFWRQVLADRHGLDAPARAGQEVSIGGPH